MKARCLLRGLRVLWGYELVKEKGKAITGDIDKITVAERHPFDNPDGHRDSLDGLGPGDQQSVFASDLYSKGY